MDPPEVTVSFNGTHFHSINTFLFDLDGTLIDSLDLHIEAFQWVLNQLGKSVARETLEPLMGRTPQDIIKQFFADMSREELLHAARLKEDKLAEIIDHVYVYPHIQPFLQELKRLGLKLIVISSTHKKLVEILLQKAGLLPYLDDIVSGDEVKNGKPDPEPFALGVQKAKSISSKAVAIGDSVHDYQSAIAAGVNFIGILTGKTEKQTFVEYGLTNLISNINELSLQVL